jgi:inhibitor of the pro-sigma K processing machinery
MQFIGLLLAFAAGLLVLYVLALLLVVPLKWLGKLFINSLIGFIVLAAINLIGSTLFGFTVALNPLNALIAGAFGVPGVILIILLSLFL